MHLIYLKPNLSTIFKSFKMKGTDAEFIIDKMADKTEDRRKDEHTPYLFIALFYFLGTAAFVPHSFYVTANEYWMYKFRDTELPFNGTETVQKTRLQQNFTANVGIAGNVGMITCLFLMRFLHKRISIQKRIIGSMIFLLVLFIFTLLLIHVDTDSWQNEFFGVALGIGVLLNASTVALMVSLFQLASKFPPRCLVAQMAGQNICGIVAGVVQVISLAAAQSVTATATLYYSVATITIAIILVGYIIVQCRSEEFREKLETKADEQPKKEGPKFELDVIKSVFRKLALLIVALILSAGNTGILHPGLTALVESSMKGTNVWADSYFLPVCVFLSFNTFEFIAREASNHFEKLKSINILLGTSVFRLVLFPLILLCNIQPRNHLPVIFHDDAYFIIFMIIFALTGGYMANVSLLVISKYCEPEERMIGTLLVMLIMVVFVPVFSIVSGMVVNLI